jgi:GxxExxY protein
MNMMNGSHRVGKDVLYPEWSYAIIGAAMEVHNGLGPGWDEEACHLALLHALHSKGLKVKSVLQAILDEHGLGYHGAVYRKLFKIECAFQQVKCEQPIINLMYGNMSLGMRTVDAFCIDSRVLVLVTAIGNSCTKVDKIRMKNYLRETHCAVGFIANFGSHALEICIMAP